jgi:hypothetical protein
MLAVTVSLGVGIDLDDKESSLRFHPDILRVLERQKRHEVSVMHDESLRGALNEVAFGGVRRDDMAHGVGNAALHRQGYAGEGMS